MIDWFSQCDAAYDPHRAEDHKTHDFWAYQAMVALRGDWPRLVDRCERVLADPPRASREQKYLGDHHFYLALARRDKPAMEQSLSAMVALKAVYARKDDDSGYMADLVSSAAVIYAKIAWLHGHEVRVKSSYIPAEWLPCTPLDRYDAHYSFLA